MNTTAIAGAIRGVLLGTLGSVRTVPAATFAEWTPAGVDDSTSWLRSTIRKSVDVRISPPTATGDIGSPAATPVVLSVDVDVIVRYASAHIEDLLPDRRYEVRALAATDASVIGQALTWPGNLAADATPTATGIVSGLLAQRASPTVTREDWPRGIYETTSRFRALVLETRAVS